MFFKFMKEYLPLLALAFAAVVSFLPGTLGYHVYLDRNFGEKKNCLSDVSSFFGPTDLTPPDPGFTNDITSFCDNHCSTDNFSNSHKISSLEIIQSIGFLVQINLSSNSDPYSQVKLELTYFGKYAITAELQYPDTKDTSFSFSQATAYSFTNYASYTLDPSIVDTSFDVADASTVICPDSMRIKASSLTLAKSAIIAVQSPEPALVLRLTLSSTSNLSYLRSIRVSKNCVENCLVCGSDTSCSTCQDGFASNTFSSGVTACEQVGSVCSALSNCLSCAISGADSVCLSCFAGFTLSSGACTADTPTPATTCTATQYNSKGTCTEYSSLGYYESRYDSSLVPITSLSAAQIQTTYKCPQGMLVIATKENNYSNYKCKCFFAQCISCSSFASCDVCASGFIFDYSSKLCVVSAVIKNDLSIKQNVTYTGYTFKIKLSNGIQYSNLKASDISVSITDFTAFTYSLVGMTNGNTISISVACNKLVKHKKITITFTNFAFVSANGLNQSSISTDLEPYLNLSQVEYNRAKMAKTIAQVIATIIVWFLIPIGFLGYFATIMPIIDVVAFLYYILYISARFPINVISYAQAFKILQLDLVINFFGSLVNADTFLDSPVQWMKQSTDCYFLASTGQSISVFTVVIGLYLFTKMMANMDFAYISDYFKKAVIRTWEFGGILDGVWLVFIYAVVGVFLQFQDLSCNTSSCSLNYTLMAFSGVIAGIVPIFVFYLVRYAASVTYESYLVMKLAPLFTGVRLFAQKDLLVAKEEKRFQLEIDPAKKSSNEQQQSISFCSSAEIYSMNKRQKLMFIWTKYVIPILYVRKVVFALIICFLYNVPYLQIVAISLVNFAAASYFLIIQPFSEKHQNLKAAVSEFVLIVFQGLAALLISDKEDQSEDTRILIGWGLITIASLLILWHAISIIVQFSKVARVYYLNWKQKRSRAKIVSLDVNDQSSNNSPDIKRKPILQFQDYSRKANQQGNNGNAGICEEHPGEEDEEMTNNQSPLKKGSEGQIMRQLSLNVGQKSQDNLLMHSPERVRNSKLSIIAGYQQSNAQSFQDLPQSSNQVQGVLQQNSPGRIISLKEKAK